MVRARAMRMKLLIVGWFLSDGYDFVSLLLIWYVYEIQVPPSYIFTSVPPYGGDLITLLSYYLCSGGPGFLGSELHQYAALYI